jgi:hypothetical protein
VSSPEKHWSKTKRSGQWARRQARKDQLAYVRRAWKAVALYLVIVLATAPVLWLVPSGWRMFALGAYLATFGWVLYHAVATEAGTVHRMAGAEAEQQTARTLRASRRHGWKSLQHVYLGRGGDVDHVLIGPAGLVVLETKWSTVASSVDGTVDKIRRDARRLELVVRRAVGETRVHPVIVVCGPAADAWERDSCRRDGVTIVPGRRLHAWLAQPRPEKLGPEQQERAWTVLTDQFALREAYEDHR